MKKVLVFSKITTIITAQTNQPMNTEPLLKRLATEITTPEPGWKTVFQLIEDSGGTMSKTTARELLNKAVKDGVVEAKKQKVIHNGKVRTMTTFREIK